MSWQWDTDGQMHAPRPSHTRALARWMLTAATLLFVLLPVLEAVAQQRPAARPQERTRPGARPPVQREALPPPPAPVHRRVLLAEIGQGAGTVFDTAPRMLRFPLPPGLGTAGLRLAFQVELIAPFAGRHAVEVAVNGRPVGALPFAAGQTRLGFEALVPPADIQRAPAALGVSLRLLDPDNTGARATLLPSSYLTMPVPPAAPELATFTALLPPRLLLLAPPDGFDATTAGEALRLGLALSARGHAVRFVAGPPDEALVSPGGRVWEAGAVLFGAPDPGAQVRMLGEAPVLAIGPGGMETALAAFAPPLPPAATRDGIAFGTLAAELPPLEGAQARWTIPFAALDLPAGLVATALDARLLLPAGSAGQAQLLLNGRALAGAMVPADGRAALAAAIPPALLARQNRIEVTLQRDAGAQGPVQLLPESVLRLAPAPAPRDFLDLLPHYARGLEVLLDAPEGVAAPQVLDTALWALQGLARPTAPLRVRLQPPAGALPPEGPFLALGTRAPPGSAPALRMEGRSVVLPRADGSAQPIGLLEAGFLAQRVAAAGQPGIWLLPTAQPTVLPPGAPGLAEGDAALLDARGVVQVLRLTPQPLAAPAPASAAPPTATVATATGPTAAVAAATVAATAAPRSAVQVWRPWVVGGLWLVLFAVVLHAFSAPRREWQP